MKSTQNTVFLDHILLDYVWQSLILKGSFGHDTFGITNASTHDQQVMMMRSNQVASLVNYVTLSSFARVAIMYPSPEESRNRMKPCRERASRVPYLRDDGLFVWMFVLPSHQQRLVRPSPPIIGTCRQTNTFPSSPRRPHPIYHFFYDDRENIQPNPRLFHLMSHQHHLLQGSSLAPFIAAHYHTQEPWSELFTCSRCSLLGLIRPIRIGLWVRYCNL